MNGSAFCVKPFHSASSYSGLLFCIIQSSFLPLQWPSEMKSRESVQKMHSKSLDDGLSFLPAKVFEYFFVLDPLNLNFYLFGSTEFSWRFGDWTACSASCGNKGTWLRRIRCVSLDGKDVQPTMCQHIPKPITSPVPCNRQDCPPRYTYM